MDELALLANRYSGVAVAWHLLALFGLAAIVKGARPSRRRACSMLAMPLVSVSALAWLSGNAFNGMVFALAAVGLWWLARTLPHAPVTLSRGWARVFAALTLAYAWVYPHFLAALSKAIYLLAAPMGVLPCPTLGMVLGFGLLLSGLNSRAVAVAIAALATSYGLFGVLRLRVWLDAGLLISAMAMFLSTWRTHEHASWAVEGRTV